MVKYREFIRTKQCLVCRRPGPVDAHHVKAVGMGSRGSRPSSRHLTCVPLCRDHHTSGPGAYHQIGKTAFEEKYSIDLWGHIALFILEFYDMEWEEVARMIINEKYGEPLR